MRAVVLALCLGATLIGQTADPALTIVSPEADSYATGSVVLRAALSPAALPVRRLTFFVDARQVCVLDSPPFECTWEAGGTVKEHRIRAIAQLTDGRRLVADVSTKGIGYAEEVDVEVVQVTAVVRDAKGNYVTALTRGDFRVYEDDVEQTVRFFETEGAPLSVAVVLDMSSSMKDGMPALKRAASRFLRALRPEDNVTVLAFNENVFTVARKETRLEARLKAIEALESWGGTALYDAILRGTEVLRPASGRKALILFTDGDDQDSRSTREAVIDQLQGSDAVLFSVAQGRALRSGQFADLLKKLSEASGGRSYATDDEEDLDQSFQSIVEELSHQYLLGYTPKAPFDRGAPWRRLRVETLKDYSVRARDGYRPQRTGGRP